MKNRIAQIKLHLSSSLLPSLFFGAVSGLLAGTAVTLYKFFAAKAVELGEGFFLFVRLVPWCIPAVLLLYFLVSVFLSRLYQKEPDLKGGGIPASIGTLRGLFRFDPIKNALGSFFLSLLAFLFGVPLGTEGPSVQLGTSLGAGAVRAAPKKYHAWERFSMTGGASAGFATATGAPLSGILFAIEEAHGRISPLIVLTAITSVLSAMFSSLILSPLFGVKTALFEIKDLPVFSLKEMLLPLILGIGMGLISLLFLKFYEILHAFFAKKMARFSSGIKIFAVLGITLLLGLLSGKFLFSGHHLIGELLFSSPGIPMLLAILLVRSGLTLSANICGITGGIFLPILAIAAAAGSLFSEIFSLFGMSQSFSPAILCLAIGAGIAGMMKMPLTAILFSVEALGLGENLFAVILTMALAYAIPEALGMESITERALEHRKEQLSRGKFFIEEEITLLIEENSFAVGKEVRDLFWPNGVFVLSVKKTESASPLLSAGDEILLRLSTFDREKALEELAAITKSIEE